MRKMHVYISANVSENVTNNKNHNLHDIDRIDSSNRKEIRFIKKYISFNASTVFIWNIMYSLQDLLIYLQDTYLNHMTAKSCDTDKPWPLSTSSRSFNKTC